MAKVKSYGIIDHVIVFFLLAISGNPFFCYWSWIPSLFLLVLIMLFFYKEPHRLWKTVQYISAKMRGYLLCFVFLFLLQILFCNHILIQTQINYLIKIIVAGSVYLYYGNTFKYLYLNVIVFIAGSSLVLYPMIFLLGFNFISFIGNGSYIGYLPESFHTIIIYNYHDFFNWGRNFGMFWEPGVYASYLCITFIFFINQLYDVILKNKWKFLLIVIALLTTFSTTGYIVLGVISFLTLAKKNKGIGTIVGLLLFALLMLSNVVIDKLEQDAMVTEDFKLGQKIFYQGYSTANRWGSFIFLLPLFMNHPFIGNGLNPEALFSTMKSVLIQGSAELGLGNGFMLYLASVGIVGLMIFLGGIYKYWNVNDVDKIWGILIILMLLQGEALLSYTLLMGIPFLKHK